MLRLDFPSHDNPISLSHKFLLLAKVSMLILANQLKVTIKKIIPVIGSLLAC